MKPAECLTVAVISFALVPVVLYKHYTIPCALILIAPYTHSWLMILTQNQFILGPVFVAILTLNVCPTLHLFDRERQKWWGFLLLVGNLTLAFCAVFFAYPENDVKFTITSKDIKQSVLLNMFVLTIYTGFMIYINDVSNQVYEAVKRTNETIEAATREKEEFYATMSHEIRNPLQSLQGSVELMLELYRSNSSSQQKADLSPLLDICRGCCGIVINMVSNILDMSKIAADKMQLSPVSTDLRELTNRILRTSRGRAEGKSVRLELECDPELPPAIELDPQRIEQVLVNLVSNAIKFTTAKGRIVVKVSWFPLDATPASAADIKAALSQSNWTQTMEFAETTACLSAKCIPPTPVRQSRRAWSRVPSGEFPGQNASSARLPEVARRLEREGVAKIEVMDTGIGMSKEGLAKLFKPYQQADSSISRLILCVLTE